jgi:HD-GYP domain-containing protein (c-di-GMP phosphodiesterase class II)
MDIRPRQGCRHIVCGLIKKIFLEPPDIGNPDATATLPCAPEKAILMGTYFQAVQRQNDDVMFVCVNRPRPFQGGQMPDRKKRLPFYVGITTLLVIIVIVLSSLFLWISHRESKVAAIQMADRLFSEINAKTLQRYEHALESVAILSGTAARMPGMAILPTQDGMSHPAMPVMLEALSFYDFLFSTYCGYADGSFIQIVAVRNREDFRKLFDAPEATYFVLRTIAADQTGSLQQRWHFLDRSRQVIGKMNNLDSDYNPRNRPWYIRAQQETGAFFTQPYVFSSTRLPGITCAEKLLNGDGVFGADITLDRFTRSLKRQKISDGGTLFLFDRDGRIIANPMENPIKTDSDDALDFLSGKESADPRVRAVVTQYRRFADALLDHTWEMIIDDTVYLVRCTPLKAALRFDQIIASIAPVADFTGHIQHMRRRIFLFSGLVLLVVLPLSFFISRKISSSLVRLERESIKIQLSDFSESAPFDSSIKEIHSLITAFFLMKTKIRRLLEQQRKLFDDFTKLIAGAIDAKSPYTGGHCARVPVAAEMLAEAACRCDTGPFADFSMDTEDERWEFEVAAWLHDCGKVTTPEYVVDKATKLETIYNRIHEIRMRFEVLLRDAQIDYFRKRYNGDTDPDQLKAELKETQRQITEDFAFVAECNIGGEFMADEKIERLHRIAARTWLRHLDDRIGISQDEAALKNRQPPPRLPVVERILTDKPEHLIPRTDPDPFEGNPHGFKMPVPVLQYNLGELYNLCIRKGTLSQEDRFKINEHIIQTIIMLGRLEFPEYLKNVPEFAGAHHETMIGTGYPRGLKKEQMSIPARIMAISDIFEALTAADRPYKSPKPLSEALRIMSVMRDEKHIDTDLFDLFLTSGVFQTYAEKYLRPSQMDAVDVSQYLATPPNQISDEPG